MTHVIINPGSGPIDDRALASHARRNIGAFIRELGVEPPNALDWDTNHMNHRRGRWSARGIVLHMQRIARQQRDREHHDLGYRDLGGES